MIIRECKNLESTIQFYEPFEYTNDIVFSFSVFQDLDLVHCYIAYPKNKILFNMRLYRNIHILRAKTLKSLSNKDKSSAIKDIRKATRVRSIKELHYGGNGLFESTFISRVSLENVIKYFTDQERFFGKMSAMSWDGFNGWGSEVITPTPLKKEVHESNGDTLKIVVKLIEGIKENVFNDLVSDDDYRCLEELLFPATRRRHAGSMLQLRAMELIDLINLPWYYDRITLSAHPRAISLYGIETQDCPIWIEYFRHANHYLKSMENAYPWLKWDLETSGDQKAYFEDMLMTHWKYEIPNWSP